MLEAASSGLVTAISLNDEGGPVATSTFTGVATTTLVYSANTSTTIFGKTLYQSLSPAPDTSETQNPSPLTPTTSTSSSSTTPVSTAVTSTTDTSQTGSTSGVTPSPTSKNNNPVSGGGAAGIGIGGLLIGALLALLIAFILMKRSRKHRSQRHSNSFDTEQNLPGAPIGSSVLDETRLDRVDDSQLRKSMQDLNELIDQHVENNYHSQAFVGSQGALEKGLAEAGYSTEPTVSEIASLLVNQRTRFAAIREVIAKILVGNLEVRSRPELSLLPPQIVGFVKNIPPVERLSGADEVFDKAFTKWRHLSAFLLEPSRTSREAPKANEREVQAAIGHNVALINSILKPFINPGVDSQRSQESNLSAIIFEGAQLGLLLFSQPSVWTFNWKVDVREESSGRRGGRPFIIFPVLGEQVESHGKLRLREVCAPVVIEL